VDFLVAAFGGEPAPQVTVVLEGESRDAAIQLSTRWRRPVARPLILEDGLSGVARLVDQSDAEHVVLASASCVFLAEPAALRERIGETGDQVAKLSVARTPVEVYFSRREHLCRLLAAAAERDSGRSGLRQALFQGVLHESIDFIVEVPGEILFQNDLMEYYANNIWVVANCESPRLHGALSRLPELAQKIPESHVSEKGFIRNAWLSCGVEVEGSVEDSILFPNVVVRRNAAISRSVILNGNRVGTGTEITSALVLPFVSEAPRPSPNIGDNCSIGARGSSMKNADFPEQIRNGVSVVGVNADIPNGFKAEAATYIAPGVPPSALRKLKLLKRGCSVLREPAARGGGNGSGSLR